MLFLNFLTYDFSSKHFSCLNNYFLFFSTEPNLLSGTAHSVNKRGVKRRDLDIEELREILSPLLPFVRIEHILPMSSEVLSDAVSQSSHTSIIS